MEWGLLRRCRAPERRTPFEGLNASRLNNLRARKPEAPPILHLLDLKSLLSCTNNDRVGIVETKDMARCLGWGGRGTTEIELCLHQALNQGGRAARGPE